MKKTTTRPLVRTLLAAAAFAALAATPSLRAVTFAETTDAGQTLATAQATGTDATTALTAISGTLVKFDDADLFVLTITSTTTFSAIATSTAGIDTSLFLFTAAGVPVLANDDQSGTSFQAALPTGNSLLTSLAAGTYYLGVSLSGNEAVNLNNQQLFTLDQPTTNVRGSAAGLNPTTLSTFNGGTFFTESGDYSIALTGAATATAAVPEPSTYATLLAGSALAAFALRRRRQNVNA